MVKNQDLTLLTCDPHLTLYPHPAPSTLSLLCVFFITLCEGRRSAIYWWSRPSC